MCACDCIMPLSINCILQRGKKPVLVLISKRIFLMHFLITFWGFFCLKKNAFDMRIIPNQPLCCLAWFSFLVLLVSRSGWVCLLYAVKTTAVTCMFKCPGKCSAAVGWRWSSFVGENPDVWWFQCTVSLFVSMPRVIIEKGRNYSRYCLICW